MPEINIVPNTAIPRIPIIEIPVEQSIPNTSHITKTLPPALIMPCATLRNDGTENSQLFIDDPSGNKLICPLPYYVPLQYDKKKILLVEEQKPHTNVEPPETITEQPEVPKVDKNPPCPDPKKNNPRIGDLNAKGTEKVVGVKWVEETKECVVQYEPTTAATLTPILNRVLKPLFTQVIGKVKKAIGKKGTKFSGKKPMKNKINKV